MATYRASLGTWTVTSASSTQTISVSAPSGLNFVNVNPSFSYTGPGLPPVQVIVNAPASGSKTNWLVRLSHDGSSASVDVDLFATLSDNSDWGTL